MIVCCACGLAAFGCSCLSWTNPLYFVLRDNERVTGLRRGEGGKMGCGFPCKQIRQRGESCDPSICLSAPFLSLVSSLFASVSHSHFFLLFFFASLPPSVFPVSFSLMRASGVSQQPNNQHVCLCPDTRGPQITAPPWTK